MQLNYIYTYDGKIEYVIIPVKIWERIRKYVEEDSNEIVDKSIFNPAQYRGILSFKNIDIETELRNLRNEWNRNI